MGPDRLEQAHHQRRLAFALELGHLCVESEFGPWYSGVGGGQTRP
jgi:hypothetical protein